MTLVTQKLYWSVGELAEMLKVHPYKIRAWCAYFGDVKKKGRGEKRFFTAKDVERFKRIHQLLEVELHTYKGAKLKLK